MTSSSDRTAAASSLLLMGVSAKPTDAITAREESCNPIIQIPKSTILHREFCIVPSGWTIKSRRSRFYPQADLPARTRTTMAGSEADAPSLAGDGSFRASISRKLPVGNRLNPRHSQVSAQPPAFERCGIDVGTNRTGSVALWKWSLRKFVVAHSGTEAIQWRPQPIRARIQAQGFEGPSGRWAKALTLSQRNHAPVTVVLPFLLANQAHWPSRQRGDSKCA